MDLTVDNIFSEIKKLKLNEQVFLAKKIALLLKQETPTSKTTKLTQITGLGSHIWTDVNIEKYIEEERQW